MPKNIGITIKIGRAAKKGGSYRALNRQVVQAPMRRLNANGASRREGKVGRPQADETRERRESPNLKSSYQSRVSSEKEEVNIVQVAVHAHSIVR